MQGRIGLLKNQWKSMIVAVSVAVAIISPSQVAAISQTETPPPNLAPLEAVANSWLKRPELAHSLVGLEIMHIPSGHVIFSFNGRRRFVPASTTKVFPTACAMDNFGPDFRFTTKLKAYGKIEGSRLDGSLFLEPTQDPTFKTENLKNLLHTVALKGITSIEGKVDLVHIPGGGDHFDTAWLAEDWGQDWMPVSSDLVLDDNIARRDPARGYKLVSHSVEASNNALMNSLLKAPTGPAWVCFDPHTSQVEFWHPDGPLVGGQIVGNPTQYNLAVIKSILKSQGTKVKDRPLYSKDLTMEPTVIGEHQSKPLSEIIKHCLKESDNLYAQQLLRKLGTMPPINKAVEKGTLEERGLARLREWLTSIGVVPSDAILWDGCGLSRKNAITPHALNLVHRHMAMSNSKAYIDVMPLDPGVSGSSTKGTFRYKTGAMDSVRTISGIVTTAANEPLAVTVMVNAHTPSVRDVRASMGMLIDHLQTLGSLRFEPEPPPPVVKKPAVRSSSAAAAKRKQPATRKRRARR